MSKILDIDIDDGCPVCTKMKMEFKLESEEIGEGFVKVKCSNCDHVWDAHYTINEKE